MSKIKQSISIAEKANIQNLNTLENRIVGHINNAKQAVLRTVDSEMVKAYWLSGQDIVLAEQEGDKRARYGHFLIKEMSERLTQLYGRGFSITTLKEMRKFYLEYQSDSISTEKGHAVRGLSLPSFNVGLGWTHYRALMRVKHKITRQFYEKEAVENCWSARELERQIGSLLFERLAKSKDKAGLLELVRRGQEIHKPEDVMKDPVVLEFLGLPESHQLVESKLEEALINNMQNFLLELGKGFSFVARQKRLTLDGDYFYADLVFYHVILKCYVIIDIKIRSLSHADLGQMQLYVNYFDQEIKQSNDNPTIGLVLCTQKKEKMAKYLLGENAKQIFTSTYQFHLPTEAELEQELKQEIKAIKHNIEFCDGHGGQ
tara:strand:- start:9687 stop:10808 length:1122 start_codon:yes stop_codon:yes gene_type:complete